MRALTLLLLSGGGHTGSNVMASLAARRAGLRLVATSDRADEPALFAFDAVYLAPGLAENPPGFERRVLEIIARERPEIVVPCRDDDVQFLAGLGERRADLASRFLCGPRVLAEVVNDKWRSFEFSAEHGLPFVPSLACGDAGDAAPRIDDFIARHGLPLVAKPRQGVDSNDIVLLTTRAHALRAMRRAGCVLQKYLGEPAAIADHLRRIEEEGVPLHHTFQGPKRSLQALIGPAGSIEQLVCTRNLVTARHARSIAFDDDDAARRIGEAGARVFARLGWRGPLNIQCQPDAAGELLIHEFNGRYTGATAARWHLGCDEIGAAVRAFTGHRLEPGFPWREQPAAAVEGLWPRAADRGSVRELSERGEWTRASG